jgi:accessory gene regulator protein AgrB
MAINFFDDLEDITAMNMKFSLKIIFMKLLKVFVFYDLMSGLRMR